MKTQHLFRVSGLAFRIPHSAFRVSKAAFTLLELLTVIAIIAILAALLAPTLNHFRRGDATLSATRQLIDDCERARQLAISCHTTVYMVFIPTNFWNDNNYKLNVNLTNDDRIAATNLIDKQWTGYCFITLRSLGDQPGQYSVRYLSPWRTLPDNAFIADWKFTNDNSYVTVNGFNVYGFHTTNNIPFPLPTTQASGGIASQKRAYPNLPYIAFNYLGQPTTEALSPEPTRQEEFIPLAQGSVSYDKDANKKPQMGTAAPDILETPAGNSTNIYNLVHIDAMTGRARLEHQEVQ